MDRFSSATPLLNVQTQSRATARADIPRSIAGRARYLYEMLTGESSHNDACVARVNPSGDRGLNFSGPPFGPAKRHVVWGFSGLDSTLSTWKQNQTGGTVSYVSDAVSYDYVIDSSVWVRPFARWETDGSAAPYSRPQIIFSAYAASGTPTLYISGTGMPEVSKVLSSGTTENSYTDADLVIPMRPGLNRFQLRFYFKTAATAAITGVTLNNVHKIAAAT